VRPDRGRPKRLLSAAARRSLTNAPKGVRFGSRLPAFALAGGPPGSPPAGESAWLRLLRFSPYKSLRYPRLEKSGCYSVSEKGALHVAQIIPLGFVTASDAALTANVPAPSGFPLRCNKVLIQAFKTANSSDSVFVGLTGLNKTTGAGSHSGTSGRPVGGGRRRARFQRARSHRARRGQRVGRRGDNGHASTNGSPARQESGRLTAI
jgi:hypothetical protein